MAAPLSEAARRVAAYRRRPRTWRCLRFREASPGAIVPLRPGAVHDGGNDGLKSTETPRATNGSPGVLPGRRLVNGERQMQPSRLWTPSTGNRRPWLPNTITIAKHAAVVRGMVGRYESLSCCLLKWPRSFAVPTRQVFLAVAGAADGGWRYRGQCGVETLGKIQTKNQLYTDVCERSQGRRFSSNVGHNSETVLFSSRDYFATWHALDLLFSCSSHYAV
jgi:hypothetical protein